MLVLDAGRAGDGLLNLPLLRVDPATGRLDGPSGPLPDDLPLPDADDHAYVFFTSGTTGEPKGLLGVHRAIDHFVAWERAEFGIGPADRVAQLTSLSFDAVLRDLLVPLSGGAAVCVPDDDERDDVLRMLGWLDELGVTLVHTTPSVVGSWLTLHAPDRDGVRLSALRYLALSGEPLLGATVAAFAEVFPQCRAQVVNLYGPTETTMVKTSYPVPTPATAGVQPIGCPQPHTQVLVLGAGDRVCGPGERGEIVLRTPFRTAGYLAGPDGGFTPNPFRDDPADLLYRTGDIGLVLPDRHIRPEGRRDGTVKIRGVRVHPDEVAVCGLTHPGVAACHVQPVDQDGEQFLVAFVVRRPGAEVHTEDLREHFEQRLPDPAVPRLLLFVDGIPLQANGKVDSAQLLNGEVDNTEQRHPAPPRTPSEHAVAKIWAELLRQDEIGVDDNFFRSGGHSLLATVMITRIRKAMRVALTLRQVMESPTVAGIAAIVDRAKDNAPTAVSSRSGLLLLGPQLPGVVPLVVVHPIGGDVLCYRELADALGYPLLAIRADGLGEGGRPREDLREMAAAYLHELRSSHQGPYLLGGWSFGGVVAFEMARQLVFDGEDPALLVLFDSYAPGSPAYDGFDAGDAARRTAFLHDLTAGTPRTQADPEALLDPAELDRYATVFGAHSRAVARYRLDTPPGWEAGTEVVLFAGTREDRPDGVPQSLGWAELLGRPVPTVPVDADHYSMLSGPVVAGWAGRLRALLPAASRSERG